MAIAKIRPYSYYDPKVDPFDGRPLERDPENNYFISHSDPALFTPQKIVDPRPVGIRWLAKPDGELVLQFGQAWTRGSEYGIDWEDVPVIKP